MNTLITGLFIIVIIIAVFTFVYVNLDQAPEDEEPTNGDEPEPSDNNDILLTIIYQDQNITYTLEELQQLPVTTGNATFLKEGALPTVIIDGPIAYEGVTVTSVWDQDWDLPDTYNISVTASDDWVTEYNHTAITGTVMTFNETTGNSSGYTQATLLLAYKEDGILLNESTGGPLKLVYINDTSITSSRKIAKYVVTIEITS